MNRKKKSLNIIVLVLVLLSVFLILYRPQIRLASDQKNLNIKIFKVGKADAIVVENNNEYMVIDVGEEDDGFEIVNYLQDREVFKIKKLIITHFDKDHVGGADTLVENIEVEEHGCCHHKIHSKISKLLIHPLKHTLNIFIFILHI